MSASEADGFLIEAVQRGDDRAWRQVIERYEGRLLAFARRMLAQPGDAEDTVQETFLGLLRSLPNYDRARSLETYLFAILRHKLHDQFRRQPRGWRQSLDRADVLDDAATEAAERLPVDPETPSDYLAGREQVAAQRAALVTALRQYVQQCREQLRFSDLMVLESLVVEGLRNKDAAERFGLAQTAVAGIKFRAIEALRKLAAAAAGEASEGMSFGWSEADLARDSTLGVIWREEGVSCLKRSTLGAYLLGVLDEGWEEYVDFHVRTLACDVCQANLDDLEAEETRDAAHRTRLRERCFASSVGFLSRPPPASS